MKHIPSEAYGFMHADSQNQKLLAVSEEFWKAKNGERNIVIFKNTMDLCTKLKWMPDPKRSHSSICHGPKLC